MDKSKFISLAEAYGSDLNRWPEDQKLPAMTALEQNPDWLDILNTELTLDRQLDQYQLNIDVTALESRILRQTIEKAGLIDKVLGWLLPDDSLLRPALVACIPVLLGVVIGTNLDLGLEDQFVLSDELQYIQFDSTYGETQNVGGYN